MFSTKHSSIGLILTIFSLLSFVLLLAGCGQNSEEVVLAAAPTPASEIPTQVTAAREAVLAFLREGANECVPSTVAKWQTNPDLPQTPAGYDAYRFTADGCTITVSYVLSATEEPIYHVSLGDVGTGFCWQAVVNANGKIEKTGNAVMSELGRSNPAALYCQEQGYEYELQTNENGTQCGMCVFPEGNSCNSWAYFYGECDEAAEPVDES